MTDLEVGRALRTLWLLMLLRGVLAVVFGLYALFSPESALLALVYVFGFYAIMDGVAAVFLGLRHRSAEWGWQVAQGVVSLIAGLVALFWPGPTVFALVLIVAVWSIAVGVAQIVGAFGARRMGLSWGWPLAGGVVTVLFGVVLLVSPGAGALTLLWIIGLTALVFGTVFVVWALRLRGAAKALAGHAA